MPKFICKTPVTVMVCIEVTARNKKEALSKASEELFEIEKNYVGIGADLDRPPYLNAEPGWFETDDECDIFRTPKAVAERK